MFLVNFAFPKNPKPQKPIRKLTFEKNSGPDWVLGNLIWPGEQLGEPKKNATLPRKIMFFFRAGIFDPSLETVRARFVSAKQLFL
jgi:hypothetical protein